MTKKQAFNYHKTAFILRVSIEGLASWPVQCVDHLFWKFYKGNYNPVTYLETLEGEISLW